MKTKLTKLSEKDTWIFGIQELDLKQAALL
jgi:hypothetical protein